MDAVGSGGWRDSQLRKNLNDESTGTIWNTIVSNDFKQNVMPVLKTNNTYNLNFQFYNHFSNVSTTIDKLWILSPSEMGMPIIKNYNIIFSSYDAYQDQSDSNVHYYDSDSYKNTIKSSGDGNYKGWYEEGWNSFYSYLYDGNTYQWWMLPAGSRKMSNGNQAYHNTDSYSYCDLTINNNPSTDNYCLYSANNYWLRSLSRYYWEDFEFATYRPHGGYLTDSSANDSFCYVVVSFSF